MLIVNVAMNVDSPPGRLDERHSAARRVILQQAADFCRAGKVDPCCREVGEGGTTPRAIFTKAGKLGLMGLMAPPSLAAWGELHRLHPDHCGTGAALPALALDIATHNSFVWLVSSSVRKRRLRSATLAAANGLARGR